MRQELPLLPPPLIAIGRSGTVIEDKDEVCSKGQRTMMSAQVEETIISWWRLNLTRPLLGRG